MAYQISHPKNTKLCVFCKGWTGDANMVFKNIHTGYQFDMNVVGQCIRMGSNHKTSSQTHAANCPKYSPSVEADRLL